MVGIVLTVIGIVATIGGGAFAISKANDIINGLVDSVSTFVGGVIPTLVTVVMIGLIVYIVVKLVKAGGKQVKDYRYERQSRRESNARINYTNERIKSEKIKRDYYGRKKK